MLNFIDKIQYVPLILITLLMLCAPFKPMPHVIEKLLMLKNGTLQRPIDIFDLFFHCIPLILLMIKFVRSYLKSAGS